MNQFAQPLAEPKLIAKAKCFEGWVEFYSHPSINCATEMKFGVFRPPQAKDRRVPVLYWLSGLTCTEQNFIVKAGAEQYAAQHGLMLVAPDTSPRGAGLPGEDESWDFGLGAGYYVNATQPPWSTHYRMYDYVSRELPSVIERYFPVLPDRVGIFGHSMGGHGALVLALREPGRFRSVSAFSPICAPSLSPWGQKAFTKFLGPDQAAWRAYDANLLVAEAKTKQSILIDQGTDDRFMREQLMPEVFKDTCESVRYPLVLRMHAGYDHSYYFISSFIKEHVEYHARFLNNV